MFFFIILLGCFLGSKASTIVVLSNDPPSDHFFHFNESYTLKETEEIIALEESALLLSIVNGTTKWFELNGESISQCLGSISNVSLYVCETSEQISVISDLTAIIPFLTPYSFSVGRVSRFISKVGETTYEASEASKIVVDLITEFSKQFQKDSDKSVDSVKKMVLKSFGSSAEKVGKMLLKIGQHKLVKYLNHYGIGVFLSKRETATSPAHISNNVQYLSVAKGSDYNNEHLNDVSDFNDNENAKGFIDFVKNNEYINNAKDFVKNNEYIDNAKDFVKNNEYINNAKDFIKNNEYINSAKEFIKNNEYINNAKDFMKNNEYIDNAKDFVKNNEYINNAKDFVKNNEYINNAKDFVSNNEYFKKAKNIFSNPFKKSEA